jgi:hypothetical protein
MDGDTATIVTDQCNMDGLGVAGIIGSIGSVYPIDSIIYRSRPRDSDSDRGLIDRNVRDWKFVQASV